ncbi:MAG: ROK family protein, partial [Burkholderiales bacterium]|nr:ROK family protein [Anaerolineae bacterium]
ARLDQQLNFLQRKGITTEAQHGLDATLKRILDLIHKVLPTDGSKVEGIGISAPGPLNPQTGVIVAPPNLPGWHNVPLGDILHEEFNVPVYVGNDANVAVLAEVARGAALDSRNAIYITVSTGIGGGVITDGRLLLGKDGLAAEVGHMVLIVDGGRVSSLEKEAAGPALARQSRQRIAAGEKSLITDLVNGNLDDIGGKHVGNAAEQGDKLALDVISYGGRILGLGIVTLLHLFNPEVIVIGGGVSNVGDLLFNPMREAIEKHSLDRAYWENLQIKRAALKDDVSIVGAAALVVTQGGVKDVTTAIARLDSDVDLR